MNAPSIEVLKSLEKFKCKIFTLVHETFRINTKEVNYYIVKHPGATVIIPLLDDDTLVLVRQLRPSIRQEIYEFPAGLLETGEEPLASAKRELAEEVSYQAENWESLGKIHPAPGFCDEIQHIFLAKNLSHYSLPQDEDEVIEPVSMSVTAFEELVAEGKVTDAKTLAAFTLARIRKLI